MKNTSSPTRASNPFSFALNKLDADLAPIREKHARVVVERLAAEKGGAHLTASFVEPEQDLEASAMRLLNGAASAHVASPKRRRIYSEILTEQKILERALEIGGRLHEQLRLKAREELAEAHLPEFSDLMRQKAQAVIGLERIEQTIEAVIKGTSLQNYELPLGRLRNSASRLYTFLDQMMRLGFIGQKDLQSEYEAARKADPNR
jgi:hypothetical protein